MKYLIPIAFFLLLCPLTVTFAQKRSKATIPTGIEGKTTGMTFYEGFFNFYHDPKTDKIYLVIDKPDEEFLYVHGLASGLGSNDIGLDRNQLGGEAVVHFERHGPKLLLVQANYDYRAISDNMAEQQAVNDAFARSVLWGFSLVTEEKGKVLVDATDFFLEDIHHVAGQLKRSKQGNFSVDKSRSAMYLERTRNFPDNTEFEAILTFTGNEPGRDVRSVTPSGESITLRQHHSFVRLPDENYQPRTFDPRAGYFSLSYQDYATPISEPLVKRFITRHRLKKKDPSAVKSEPVSPIVYYLDPGTPEPIRSALMEGASWWNQAFEAAGYINAFQVKMLPEGADPLDVRYNMINWVHRSTRGWSYGSSVVDPRTGEIIKGHVLLGSLRVRQDYLIAVGLLSPYKTGSETSQMQDMALARLRQLAAHEVGHTLGLAHSYASSTEDRASVMDYPHPLVNISEGKLDLSDAYDAGIGAWDKVAIAYGYKDFAEGTDEAKALDQIIRGSLDRGLSFLSDQDARPAGGAHPYAHLWDNGRSASQELERILDVRKIALKNFGENSIRPGHPYSELEEVLVPIYFLHRYQMEAAVKLIGGLNYRYALRGDGQLITEMISGKEQEHALQAVLQTLNPETLSLDENILQLIPPRPIGYDRTREMIKVRTGLTFDPLGAAESAAGMTVDLLLNGARAERLVEYHARNPALPGLNDVLHQTLAQTVMKDKKPGLPGEIQAVVNDVVIEGLITLAANGSTGPQARAITRMQLTEMGDWLDNHPGSGEQQASRSALTTKIKNYLENPVEYKPEVFLSPPDGSPIGMSCDY